jgi:diadenosine tetraphosphate (Ap4A) HIT family hydrolase
MKKTSAQPDQQLKKNARVNGDYDQIWQNTGKCVFCDLKEKYVLLEENEIVLTINLYPYIDGQLMAIPRQHIRSPKELTAKQWETMRKFSYLAKKMLKKIYGWKGMWTLIREGGEQAQMTVSDHLHVQFIPFDKPDLCQWNYRQLKNTPLENAQKFKEQKKLMIETLEKFEKKYKDIA